MKEGSLFRRLSIVLFVVVFLCTLSQSGRGDDDSAASVADLFKHMYEGGLISAEDYEFAVGEGHLPKGGVSSQVPTEASGAADAPTALTGLDALSARLTRPLSLDGEPVSFFDLQAQKELALRTKANPTNPSSWSRVNASPPNGRLVAPPPGHLRLRRSWFMRPSPTFPACPRTWSP